MFYRGKQVLVTGGTGLIGQPLVRLLLAQGAHVRVVSLDSEALVPEGASFLRADLTQPDACARAVEGIECVFHLAGVKGSVALGRAKGASFFVPHLLMNTLMMEAARRAGVDRYLYTSTVGVYHPAETMQEDHAWDGPPHPSDRYAGWAKRMGELQAEAYREEHGWDRIAIVRPTAVYGPHDNFDPRTALVVPALIARMAAGEDPLVVWGDGSAERDFLYAPDCAEGMLLALEKGANCTPINLAGARPVSIHELVETLARCFDRAPRIEWQPGIHPGQRRRVLDGTRARQMLGFEARTSLEDGLRETVRWYLAHRQAGVAGSGRFSALTREEGGCR